MPALTWRAMKPPLASRTPTEVALALLLVLWLAFPLLQGHIEAEDALPFIAAGAILRDQPDAVYPRAETPTSWSLDPAFVAEACVAVPDGATCDPFPFLSPPVVLPIAWITGLLGPATGALALRLVGCAGAVGGMWALQRRLGREAASALLVTALALTPMVYVSSAVGQTSTLLFASVAIGIATTNRTRPALLAALVWVATIAFKLFPLGLIPIAAIARRWRFLAWSAGLLAVLLAGTGLLAPPSIWSSFTSSTGSITATTIVSTFNLSVDAIVVRFVPDWNGTAELFVPFLAVRTVALGALFLWRMRRADPDVQWAWGWTALLLVHPQVWWHYGILLVGALAVGVGARGDRRRPWELWSVTGGAVVTLLLTGFTDQAILLPLFNAFAVAVLAYLTVACAAPTARPAPDDVVDRPG